MSLSRQHHASGPGIAGTPKFTFSLAWNEQLSRDAAHRWFRGIVKDAAVEAFGEPE